MGQPPARNSRLYRLRHGTFGTVFEPDPIGRFLQQPGPTAPKPPSPPKAPPTPIDPAVLEARRRERARQLGYLGRSGTILTGPQGVTTTPILGYPSLLGR